jgi:hypothetical protein
MPAILVPYRAGDAERERAWGFVRAHYERQFPDWELIEGSCDGAWSKGVAVADAYSRTDDGVLIIADADSFISGDAHLRAAVDHLAEWHWVVPHSYVYRLNKRATQKVYEGAEPHPKQVRRPKYFGPPGGGIVVLRRSAYDEVRGIDERYCGWGGEDVSFGWALDTLVGSSLRLNGDLWHLDHPHPAPNLRGSPESEELVMRYKDAMGVPRLMRALVDRTEPEPAEELAEPVRFQSVMSDRLVRLGSRRIVFHDHRFETTDPDAAEALRRYGSHFQVKEVA